MAHVGPRSRWLPYLVTVIAVAIALVLSILLDDLIENTPFLLFWPVVVVSAWYGGRGAGLLATALTALSVNYYVQEPKGQLALYPNTILSVCIFLIIALVISWFSSGRRRAEDETRLARDWLSVTLTSVGDGIIATDTEGKITFINPVTAALTGWEPQEAVGKSVQDVFRIINEQTRDPVENPIARVLTQGNIVGLANHTVLVARDGTERPIDDSGAPIRDHEGNLIGAVLVFRDISVRKQAEQKLAQFAAIVQSSDDAIISKNLDGIIQSWNPGAERMYGYRAEEMIGKPITTLVPRDMPDDVPQIIERLKRGERIDHYETRRVTKDGRVLEVSLSISPLKDATGQVIGAAKIARDVTERKLAEAAIQASERRFQLMADTVPGCVWTAAPDGSINYANRYWYTFSGLTETQTAGMEWASILHPDDQAMTLEVWSKAMRDGTPYQLEVRNRRADGEWRWLLNRAVPVKDDQGQITAWYGTSMDVTEWKAAQTAVRESEARYRMLFEDSPVSLWEQDFSEVKVYLEQLRAQGIEDLSAYLDAHPEEIAICIGKVRVLDVNKAAVALYKSANKEELLANLVHVVPEETLPMQKGFMLALAEGRTTLEETLFNKTLAGDDLWISLRWSVVSGYEDTFGKVLVSINDITALKQAEAALRESEERFRASWEIASDAMALSDEDGIVLAANPAYYQLYGYSAEEILGQSFAIIFPEARREQAVAEYRQVFNSQMELPGYESNVQHKDGAARIVEARTGFLAQDGQRIAMLSVIRDITARKQAEAALRESEQRLRTVLEAMPVLLFAEEGDHMTVLWNAECERVTGFREEEVIGRQDGVDILYPDADYQAYMLNFYNEHEGYYRNWETEATTKDGRRRVINWSNISPRFPVPGWTNWAVGIDITERKLAEERTALLQRLTASLTAALTPEQVAEVVVTEGIATLGASLAVICRLDGEQVEILNKSGVPENVYQRHRDLSLDVPLPITDAMRSREPVWIETLEAYVGRYPHLKEALQATGSQSVAALPLIANTRTLGAIGVSFPQPRVFTPEERSFLLALADQCAQALERARLYEAEQQAHDQAEERAERITSLQAITAALAQALTPAQVADIILSRGLEAAGAQAGSVILLTVDRTALEVVRTAGYDPAIMQAWQHFSLDTPSSPLAVCVQKQESYWLKTLDERFERFPPDPVRPHDRNYQSSASLPLIVDGRVIGGMMFSFIEEQAFEPEARNFILALADHCAQALQRARLYEQERRARTEAEQAVSRIERLQAVTAALSEALTVPEVAKIIVDSSASEFGAVGGGLNLLTEDRQMFEVVYSVGSRLSEEERQAYQRFSADLPLPVAEVVRSGQALWFETNAELVARYPAVAPMAAAYPGAWALIPLIAGRKTFGGFGLTFAGDREFNEEEREFMLALAHQCALALDRARLYEQEKQKAVVEERHRLARDLHDAVSQTLFAANVIAQSLPRLSERHPEKINELLDDLVRLTHGASAEMRTLLVELRPETVINNKLEELLQQFVAALKARRHIRITLNVGEKAALPEAVHVAIYRIAQETLNNIAKHSKASEVTISLDSKPEQAELRIHDNGQGFDAQRTTSGLGLTNMRERAQAIGATLEMRSTPGQGTEVRLVWRAAEMVNTPA
jgi:PAS domain S-box-containing protein